MSSVLDRPSNPTTAKPWIAWIPIAVGLAALYAPTYITLWNGVWNSDEQGHGPLILGVIAWLGWQKRAMLIAGEARPNGALGWPILLFGLLLYVLGRSQDILLFEVGSHIPVLAGAILVTRGSRPLRALWFPIFFFVFMVPLPGIFVDALTGPLKRNVSEIAEYLLYWAGYPIARSGVMLMIGPYQLLVADACSGLHSLYSLSALGLLYLYLMQHQSVLRNMILGAAILPIAFGANVLRVIFLILITYHFGDETGQGFLHGFAGVVLFLAALLLLFVLDSAVGLVVRGKPRLWRSREVT
jgi:exosortase B